MAQTTNAPPPAANLTRLGIVLGAAVLYLLGGAALAVYCFTLNPRKPEASRVAAGAATDRDEPAPPPPPPPPARRSTVAVTPAEQRQIDDAIVQGVWYLKDHILASGGWGDTLPANGASVSVGFASLPGLTLLECGLSGNDPLVQKAAVLVRQQAPQLANSYDTYQRALAVLFLDRLGAPQDEELIQYLALCLMAGQRADDGGWGYSCPNLDRKMTKELLQRLRDDRQTLDQWRRTALRGGIYNPGRSDNSNSQFAILALWVARRHNVSIDRTIAVVEKRFRGTQLPRGPDPTGNNLDLDGAWPYNPETGVGNNVWPTMTCAGLLGLAVAHGLAAEKKDPKDRPLADPAIKRGLAMLGREIDRTGEKRPPDLYFLWSLERVGVLYNLEKIEHKDWYAWGRKLLLAPGRRQADGHWQDGAYYGNNPVVDTCFALLFLKQANLAEDLSTKLRLLASQ